MILKGGEEESEGLRARRIEVGGEGLGSGEAGRWDVGEALGRGGVSCVCGEGRGKGQCVWRGRDGDPQMSIYIDIDTYMRMSKVGGGPSSLSLDIAYHSWRSACMCISSRKRTRDMRTTFIR